MKVHLLFYLFCCSRLVSAAETLEDPEPNPFVTQLVQAAYNYNFELIEDILFDAGGLPLAELNRSDRYRLLFVTFILDGTELFPYIKMLLKYGIQMSVKSYNSLLVRAVKSRYYDLLSLLLDLPESKLLYPATDLANPYPYCNSLEMARFLLNKLGCISPAALHAWIHKKSPELVNFFLENKREVNVNIGTLNLAINSSTPSILDILLTSPHYRHFTDPVHLLDSKITSSPDSEGFMAVLMRHRLRFFWPQIRLLLSWIGAHDHAILDPFAMQIVPLML